VKTLKSLYSSLPNNHNFRIIPQINQPASHGEVPQMIVAVTEIPLLKGITQAMFTHLRSLQNEENAGLELFVKWR
jgi:hypothetical protein